VICGSFLIIAHKEYNLFQSAFLVAGLFLLCGGLLFFASETWLMGAIILCLVIAGSQIGLAISKLPIVFRYGLVVTVILLIVGLALPTWLIPSPSVIITGVKPSDQIQYEEQTGAVALLPDYANYPTTLSLQDIQDIPTSPFLTE